MDKKFTLEQLTEGIRQRNVGTGNRRLVEKWSRTGLLRGLEETTRENMATLLENQAAQVLREANSLSTGGGNLTSSGDLRGFQNIAFPIVRRVFGGLVANELVSVQPMSLPSGLLFYLDYTYGTDVGGQGDGASATYPSGSSIYNLPTGKGIRSGSLGIGGQYNLAGTGYSRVRQIANTITVLASGAFGDGSTLTASKRLDATGSDGKLLQFDEQICRLIEDNPNSAGKGVFTALFIDMNSTQFSNGDMTLVKDFALIPTGANKNFAGPSQTLQSEHIQNSGPKVVNIRRLNQVGKWDGTNWTHDPLTKPGDSNAAILMIISGTDSYTEPKDIDYVLAPSLDVGSDGDALTIPTFESDFTKTPSPAIPEIDIKVESIAVTAVTRKLRARWSPELAQDLNAYHSLDAEVELTQILSEQIALELDREILNDLLTQAKTNFYWSRSPGKFMNKRSGTLITPGGAGTIGPSFTGTVREWYETLVETIIDVANEIHRLTLRGSANFIVVSPDIATILEASVLYRPSYSLDGDGQVGTPMSIGAEQVGTLSNRFTVYKDPYFPRNKVLVGFKGGSYLETGYVYAPYVPLIVTPTIFAPEDFTPRKGVMTRYGKKMVRSDFYGTVTVADLNVI